MIFLDNASTTKLDLDALKIIEHYSLVDFYNPSAPYYKAREMNLRLKQARDDILKVLNGSAGSTFVFTGSATESNNTVLLGQLNKRYKKVLISKGEHNSVSNTISEIEKKGFIVDLINLNGKGQVDVEDFKRKMDKDVGLVSIIHVSNETGAINDIKSLVEIAKEINPNCIFHSDGVQAFGKIKTDMDDLGVDFYTISGHKVHAPKGIAGLYVKKTMKPFIYGGGQQEGMHSGTENVPSSIAFAEVCKKFNIEENSNYVCSLKAELVRILKQNSNIIVNDFDNSSPYVVSIIFKYLNGETIVNALEKFDIFVGVGSACSSKKAGNSTLEAIGFGKDIVKGSVRISFDKSNTKEEIQIAGNKMLEVYQDLYKKVNCK